MIYLHPGSHTCKLIRLLALTGEFPFGSLAILGVDRSWQDLVHRLSKSQDFQVSESGFRHTCRILSLSGKGKQKSIRLYKGGLPVLEAIYPEGYAFYMEHYLQFNRKYRPACIVPDHMAVILPHCCRKYGAIPKAQLLGQDCDGKNVCCPHCGVWTTYDYLKTMTMEDINNEQKKESDH